MGVISKFTSIIASVGFLLIVSVGCARPNDTGTQQTVQDDGKPATITFYSYNTGFSNDYFQRFFVDPIKQKFPNVTLNLLQGQSPDNLVASGQLPDIVITGPVSLPVFRNLGLTEPLDGLIKKYNLNLSRFQSLLVDTIKQYDGNGDLDAVPFSTNFAALFYNKDLFDKFGIVYPKENMTWQDVLNLAKQFTRTDGGNQYVGFIPPNPNVFGTQLSLPLVDASNHAVVNTAKWAEIYGLEQQFYNLPGVVQSNGQVPNGLSAFLNNKNIAMVTEFADNAIPALSKLDQSGNSFSWDLTTYPSFPEEPGQNRNVSFKLLMISKASQHQDLDFQIIQYLTSEEEQTLITQNSDMMTALDNPEIRQSYGADLQFLKGKNITGALKSKPSPISHPSDYDPMVTSAINAGIQLVISGKLDINSALIQAQEAADQTIIKAMQSNN